MSAKLLTHNGNLASPLTRPFTPVADFARRAWAILNAWNERREQRRHLLALGDRLLQDIRLNRGDVYREARKWFWEA